MTAPHSSRAHLRLVIEPTDDQQHAWYAQSDREAHQFLARCGHLLADPSLAHWVVEQCAELVWQGRSGAPAWSGLRVSDVWLRLANLHRFFPQPRLVVAFYETLRHFLPWLASEGRLERCLSIAMLDQLERVRSPMLERAHDLLATRHRGRARLR